MPPKVIRGLLCHLGVEPLLNRLEIVKFEFSSYIKSVLHFYLFNKQVYVDTTNPCPDISYQIQDHYMASLNHLYTISIGTVFGDNGKLWKGKWRCKLDDTCTYFLCDCRLHM